MNIVEVNFDYNNTTTFFRNHKLNLKKNLTVIVNTEKGLQFGKVLRIFEDVSSFEGVELFDVVRISNKKDYFHYLDNIKLAKDAVKTCRKIVKDSQLSMTILDAYYNFDRTQLLFRFVADERVDFRNLARQLGTIFHTRIELRQIGIRDKAKEIGGVGPCGRLLCCSSFLKTFDSVTINMAKNQNVSLNPTKINGVCGRLLCCLKYENDDYLLAKKSIPKIGSNINTSKGVGKVINVNVIRGMCVVELENKERIEVNCFESKE